GRALRSHTGCAADRGALVGRLLARAARATAAAHPGRAALSAAAAGLFADHAGDLRRVVLHDVAATGRAEHDDLTVRGQILTDSERPGAVTLAVDDIALRQGDRPRRLVIGHVARAPDHLLCRVEVGDVLE